LSIDPFFERVAVGRFEALKLVLKWRCYRYSVGRNLFIGRNAVFISWIRSRCPFRTAVLISSVIHRNKVVPAAVKKVAVPAN
jgi:hypothetical protein